MVEEVEPSIRFCTYNLRRMGGDVGDADEKDADVEELVGAEGASDILRSKLESVLQESRAKQAKDLNEIEVLGDRVPIKSEKTRICIIRAHQLLFEIEQAGGGDSSDSSMAQYDNLFVAFNDALESVRTDLRQMSNEKTAKSGVAQGHLLKLQTGLTWQKLHHTVRRTQLLVEGFKHACAAFSRSSAGAHSKKVTPEDIVRLYDSITGSLHEMTQLDGYKEDEALMSQVAARMAAAKAFRCFYVAETYGSVGKWKEAQALYERTVNLMLEAVELLGSSGYEAEIPSMRDLEVLVDGAKARAHAQAFLESVEGTPVVAGAQADVAHMSLATDVRPHTLLERPDEFERPDPGVFISFPPQFETVPCKPLLFDIARNSIHYPDIQSRTKGVKRGGGWGAWLTGRS
uniref:Signal recognition particle subunit SRP68 n=1 Tax=Haptolina ericina TaxID=156174 RepID=A0A7S3AQE1_9EUKA